MFMYLSHVSLCQCGKKKKKPAMKDKLVMTIWTAL